MKHNLSSKNNIQSPIDQKNPLAWLKKEIKVLAPNLYEIIWGLVSNYESLCNFPEKPLLFWEDCDRKKLPTGKQKYHNYQSLTKEQAKQKGIYLDSRPNGPAIAAFEFARGVRPARYGSNNKWHIHHLYSGKFPYFGKIETLHAAQSGLHFTQAAGLVALHPLIDALADESPAFTWFLRYKAYEKFGYDPDCVFSDVVDKYGFDTGKKDKKHTK